ncbi:hypothetical protein H101_00981 [Trichophyton interdigitale H6]|nr:hypothetical protein H101_00981 [Trichophyton interdigitale H6]
MKDVLVGNFQLLTRSYHLNYMLLGMNDLARGVAFLESLNLAHGDLRPKNILLDRNRLKISDFDCTSEFGTGFDTCPCSYRRPLNSEEADQGVPGTAVYGDQRIADDPYEHGSKVMELLQDMKFPELNGDQLQPWDGFTRRPS